MSKVVNLNHIRKQKARSDKRARGDANAARFGRTKAERQAEADKADKARRALDGHKRDRDETPET